MNFVRNKAPSPRRNEEKEHKAEFKDYLAMIIALLETLLLPFILIMAVAIVLYIIFYLKRFI